MLTVTDLTKQFGGFTALHRASFEVREGEMISEGASTAPSDASPWDRIAAAKPPLEHGASRARRRC